MIPIFRCKECSVEFDTKNEMIDHLQEEHNKVIDKSTVQNETQEYAIMNSDDESIEGYQNSSE